MRYLLIVMFALIFLTGCEDQTGLEQFNCDRCDTTWQTCNTAEGRCDQIAGKCGERSDCDAGLICVDNSCVEGCKSNSDCQDQTEKKICDLDESSSSYGYCIVSECLNHKDCAGNSDSGLTMCQLNIDLEGYLRCVTPNCTTNSDCQDEPEKKLCRTTPDRGDYGQCYQPECLTHEECTGAKTICQLDGAQPDQYSCIVAECDGDLDCSGNSIKTVCNLDQTTSGYKECVPKSCTTHNECKEQTVAIQCQLDQNSVDYKTCVKPECTTHEECVANIDQRIKCETNPEDMGFGECYQPLCLTDADCDTTKSRCDTENYLYECAYPFSEGCNPKENTCVTIDGAAGKCMMAFGEGEIVETMCYSEDQLSKFTYAFEGEECDPEQNIVCDDGLICNFDKICQKTTFDGSCSGESFEVKLNLYTGVDKVFLCGCVEHGDCSTRSFCLSDSDEVSSYDRYCKMVQISMDGSEFCPDGSFSNDFICERFSDIVDCDTALNAAFDDVAMQCIPEYCDDQTKCSGYAACDLEINACVPYPMPLPQISPGMDHICAVTIDKTVKCVGKDGNDVAGLLDETGLLTEVTTISSGKDHACAIAQDGVYCWGKSDHNEVTLDNSNRVNPYFVDITGFRARKVFARADYSCALGTHYGVQKVFCWGENRNEMLNDASGKVTVPTETVFTNGPDPVVPIDIFGSEEMLCVLDQFHQTYCRGSFPPVTFNGTDADGKKINFIQGSAGFSHTCALAANRKVYCAGEGNSGQMGSGMSNSENSIDNPVTTLSAMTFMVASGTNHSCAISGTKVYCWGDNMKTQLGDVEFTEPQSSTPVIPDTTANGNQFSSIDLNYNQSCVSIISADETSLEFRCWGELYNGIKNTPTTITFP